VVIGFPGDESSNGGCLAAVGASSTSAGRQSRTLPVCAYSEHNLQKSSLRTDLKSDLLRKIRDNHGKLSETRGGCALWENRNGAGAVNGGK